MSKKQAANKLLAFAKGQDITFQPIFMVIARDETGSVTVNSSSIGGIDGKDYILKFCLPGEEEFWENYDEKELVEETRNKLLSEKYDTKKT